MNFPIQLFGLIDPSMSIFKPSEKTIKEAQQRRENLKNKIAGNKTWCIIQKQKFKMEKEKDELLQLTGSAVRDLASASNELRNGNITNYEFKLSLFKIHDNIFDNLRYNDQEKTREILPERKHFHTREDVEKIVKENETLRKNSFTVRTDSMSLNVKFYRKAEACSWANRFNERLNLKQLLIGIEHNLFPITTESDYSEAFDQTMTSPALVLQGIKASGVLLEDGRRIDFWINKDSFVTYTISSPDKAWLELIDKAWLAKENKNPA